MNLQDVAFGFLLGFFTFAPAYRLAMMWLENWHMDKRLDQFTELVKRLESIAQQGEIRVDWDDISEEDREFLRSFWGG